MFGNLRSLADNAKHISKNTFRELKEALRDEESDRSSPPRTASLSPRSAASGCRKYEERRVSETLESSLPRVSDLDGVCPAQTLEEFWQQPLVSALLPALKIDVTKVPDVAEWRDILWSALWTSAVERDVLLKDKSELVALVRKNQHRADDHKTAYQKVVGEVEQLRDAKSLLEDELQRLREKTKQPSTDETIAPLQQAVEDMQREHEVAVRRLRSELARSKADLSAAQEASRVTVEVDSALDTKVECNMLREELKGLKEDMRFLVKERERHFIEAENFVDRRLISQMLDRIKGADSEALHNAILSQAIAIVGTSSDQRPKLSREMSETIGDKLLQFVDEEIQEET